ncbi:MAG: cofactor assembly of complex C subunit B [Synechococcales cyanobacterium]
MGIPVIPSTFFLTLLLAIGLLFFIRAAVKDRTEVAKFISNQSNEQLFSLIKDYFEQRSYQVITTNSTQSKITFNGRVRASWFMAIFLTVLAAVGISCLSLILSMSVPHLSYFWVGLVALSPVAGLFYWKQAERDEQVQLQIDAVNTPNGEIHQLVTVTAHRDELTILKRSGNLLMLGTVVSPTEDGETPIH